MLLQKPQKIGEIVQPGEPPASSLSFNITAHIEKRPQRG